MKMKLNYKIFSKKYILSSLFFLFCLHITNGQNISSEYQKGNTNSIKINNGNKNIVNVNNGNQFIQFDLSNQKDLEKLITLISSFKSIKKEQKIILAALFNQQKDINKVDQKLDLIYKLIEESTFQNNLNSDTLLSKLDEYKKENERLIEENNILKLKFNNNALKDQVAEAEACLRKYDNECYLSKLEEIRRQLLKVKEESESNLAEISYLQAVNLVNNSRFLEALEKIEQARKTNNNSKITLCNASILNKLGRYKEASSICQSILESGLELDSKSIADSYIILASSEANYNKNYKVAIDHFKIANNLYANEKLYTYNISCLSNITNVYLIIKDTINAIKYQYELLNIYKDYGYMAGIALCYNNIGFLYGKFSSPKTGLKLLKKSISIYKGQYDSLNYGIPNSYLDNTYYLYEKIGMADSAMQLLFDAERYIVKNCKKESSQLSDIYWLIANKLFAKMEYKNSLVYYLKDYNNSKVIYDSTSIKMRTLNYQIGLNYLLLDDNKNSLEYFTNPLLNFSIFDGDYLKLLYEHLKWTLFLGQLKGII
jgi:hypothetical protein